MLRVTREELARASVVAVATIADFEVGRRQANPRTISALQAALEAAGAEFIDENGGGPGVRLKKGGTPHAADPECPQLRSVGPEDEDRAGPEAPQD
jgi:transcriptional regulator with XRE-family HTH domain